MKTYGGADIRKGVKQKEELSNREKKKHSETKSVNLRF